MEQQSVITLLIGNKEGIILCNLLLLFVSLLIHHSQFVIMQMVKINSMMPHVIPSTGMVSSLMKSNRMVLDSPQT